MFDPTRIALIKEKFETAETNLRLLKERIAKSSFTETSERSAEEEQKQSIEEVAKLQEKVKGLFGKIEEFDNREKLRALSLEKKIELIGRIDSTLKEAKSYVEKLVYTQYTAKLERYSQVIAESVESIYTEFTLLLPNISYEIELITRHFTNPYNAERSNVPELKERVNSLKKHQITFDEFLFGYQANSKKYPGYCELRTVDNIFSKYQYFENLQEEYTDINAEVYTFCKTLEMHMLSQKGNPEFTVLFEKFDDINKRSSGKTDKNIKKMSDIFSVTHDFQRILNAIGDKSSYLAEYNKAQTAFKKIQEEQNKLIHYNIKKVMGVIQEAKEKLTEEASKNKFASLEEELTKRLDEKTISFEKLEEVLEQLSHHNFDVVITDKDAADLVLKVTAEREQKYGKENLMRFNVMVEEVDFWMKGRDKQEMLEKLSLIGSGVEEGKDINMNRLKMVYNEVEHRIRKNYDPLITNIGKVIGALEKAMASQREQTRLDERVMEIGV